MEIAKLGKLGVWTWLDHLPAPEAAAFAKQLEEWGYRALWLPEAVGRDPFSFIGYLAARTEKLVFATGIANIYARDALTMRAVRETLGEASQGPLRARARRLARADGDRACASTSTASRSRRCAATSRR